MSHSRRASQSGQAATELLAALPLAVSVVAIAAQLVVAGHAWWALGEAARLAARERAVARARGESRPLAIAASLARVALPREMRRHLEVSAAGDVVRLRSRVPLLFPFSALGDGPRLTAETASTP